MISAKVIADSVNPTGNRITTLELHYPRIPVHEQLLTHRMIARNAQSARAVPIEKMLEHVEHHGYIPDVWGQNCGGMQPHGTVVGDLAVEARDIWCGAKESAYCRALDLHYVTVHKEQANRLLQPFSWIKVIATSTEWDGFLKIRNRKEPQREMRLLAEAIALQLERSNPKLLMPGQWHLPYMMPADIDLSGSEDQRRVCVARCARVSYLTHDGKRDPAKDLELYGRLLRPDPEDQTAPIHGSAFEHVAQALPGPYRSGCYTGWHPHRADIDPDWRWS